MPQYKVKMINHKKTSWKFYTENISMYISTVTMNNPLPYTDTRRHGVWLMMRSQKCLFNPQQG